MLSSLVLAAGDDAIAFLALLWTILCGVYAIIIFLIPFILFGIMQNTKRTADLLAEIRSFQHRSPDPISTDLEKPAGAPSPKWWTP
jgi:hypothetical protein